MSWYELGYERKIYHFEPKEFSESPTHCRRSVIYNLDDYRARIGRPIWPSPVSGALARFGLEDRDSHHFSEPGNLSKAIDFFAEGIPINNLLKLFQQRKWQGIGVYLDTTGSDGKPWVMFHADKRDRHLFWFRHEGKYWYPEFEPDTVVLFQEQILYEERSLT